MPTRKKSLSSKALTMLRRKLPGRVYTDTSSCYEASLDNLRLSFMPDAVVKVKQAQDIGTLLKVAHSNGIAVTPRGAGSSTTGSAVPVNGGWVLDVSALKNIRILLLQLVVDTRTINAVPVAVVGRAPDAAVAGYLVGKDF